MNSWTVPRRVYRSGQLSLFQLLSWLEKQDQEPLPAQVISELEAMRCELSTEQLSVVLCSVTAFMQDVRLSGASP